LFLNIGGDNDNYFALLRQNSQGFFDVYRHFSIEKWRSNTTMLAVIPTDVGGTLCRGVRVSEFFPSYKKGRTQSV
jgi:hypothetical protein